MSPVVNLPFAQLFRAAGKYGSETVPDEYRQSLPIPSPEDRGVVLFFFAPAVARRKRPVILFPPEFGLQLRLDGTLVKLWHLEVREFGFDDSPDQPLGEFGLRDGWTFEVYLERRSRLFLLLDALVPRFLEEAGHPVKEIQASAREFLKLFEELAEPPFAAYYRKIGAAFFSWLVRT